MKQNNQLSIIDGNTVMPVLQQIAQTGDNNVNLQETRTFDENGQLKEITRTLSITPVVVSSPVITRRATEMEFEWGTIKAKGGTDNSWCTLYNVDEVNYNNPILNRPMLMIDIAKQFGAKTLTKLIDFGAQFDSQEAKAQLSEILDNPHAFNNVVILLGLETKDVNSLENID